MPVAPSRGEVWFANLNPPTGHEQAGPPRPVVILSADHYNHGPAEMVVALPITTRERGVPLHVEVNPPEGGLTRRSFVMCDQIRSISTQRFVNQRAQGCLSRQTMLEIEDRVKILLDLP